MSFRRRFAEGSVHFNDSRGQDLLLTFGDSFNEYVFRRDGEQRSFSAPHANWRPADGSNAPIRQNWLSGSLHVEVDGATFDCSVSEAGEVTFSNSDQGQ